MTDLARLKEADDELIRRVAIPWLTAECASADPDDLRDAAAAIDRALTTLQAQAADLELLTVFGQTRNLELSYQYEDLDGEGRWVVHQVNGGINDREWTLVGAGETPLAAIRASLGKGGGHG